MEWVETVGETIDAAREAALDALGVAEDDAEFVVLSEPRAGWLGRLRVEARVRARVRPTKPRPKMDRRDRRRKRSGPEGAERPSSTTGAAPDAVARRGRKERPKRGRRADGPERQVGAAAGDAEVADAAHSEVGEVVETPVTDEVAIVLAPEDAQVTMPDAGPERRMSEDDELELSEEDDVVDQQATLEDLEEEGQAAEAFLVGLLGAFDLPGTVTRHLSDDRQVELEADGGDLGLLIGPKGQTLASIQELTRTVVQRRAGSGLSRLRVDVSGYRQRRREALERFTRGVADQVLASGQPVSLEPMSPADRKIVHDTANQIAGIVTRSEGEDPRRRVVLAPGS